MSPEEEKIYNLLRVIEDPELPVSIVDLGIVEKVTVGQKVEIVLVPTFTGCPALEFLEQQVRSLVKQETGGMPVDVKWDIGGHWDPSRISSQGRELLRAHGIAIAAGSTVRCPYCDSRHIVQDSPFGPSLCRELYYCKHCKNPFEKIKTLSG